MADLELTNLEQQNIKDDFNTHPPKERFSMKSFAVMALVGAVTTFGVTYVGLHALVGNPRVIKAAPVATPSRGLIDSMPAMEPEEVSLLQLDENDEDSTNGRMLATEPVVLQEDPGDKPNDQDLTPEELKQCKIDEQNNVLGPNKCFISSECKGKRSCTTFGWCRGKHVCTMGDRDKACNVSIQRLDPKCKNDYDCRGFRTCDDSVDPDAEGYWQCIGVPNC